MHLNYIQKDLTNPKKMENVTSIKVHYNVHLPRGCKQGKVDGSLLLLKTNYM